MERVTRRARTRRAVPRALAASALVIAAVVGTIVVTTHDGSNPGRIDSGTTPSVPTSAPALKGPPPTAPPTTTLAPGEDRLSTESRLGYAGLGPIKLGMPFDDAVAAAHVTVQPDPTCDVTLYGQAGSGVQSISVWGLQTIDTITVQQPGIRTISDIAVGSTRDEVVRAYPASVPDGPSLVIAGPGGEVIIFAFDGDTVSSMTLTADRALLDLHARC